MWRSRGRGHHDESASGYVSTVLCAVVNRAGVDLGTFREIIKNVINIEFF